jgi:dCTP diphosphatase
MPMEVSTTLAQTIDKINHFVSERDWNQFHTIKNIISSISIEAAELSETIQWSNPPVEEVLSDHSLLGNIGEEVADVMIYCLRLCSILELDPIEIMENKIKSNALKYPIGKSKGNSLKYTALE